MNVIIMHQEVIPVKTENVLMACKEAGRLVFN